MSADKKQNNTHSQAIQEAWHLLTQQQAIAARNLVDQVLQADPNHESARILQARCYLAVHNHRAALAAYTDLAKEEKGWALRTLAEANMMLEKYAKAANHLDKALKHKSGDGQMHFYAAIVRYKMGHISKCAEHLKEAIRLDFKWEDDDPNDVLIAHVIQTPEFLDFEQLYLDAYESVNEGNPTPKNRWFSLNMPIYELYSSSKPAKRRQHAQDLARLLNASEDIDLSKGPQILQEILNDFARSETDARFGLECLKHLKKGDYRAIAQLILGLVLEHLQQFAVNFGLTGDKITASQLQSLISELPLRIAVAIMYLYAASGGTEDNFSQIMDQKLESELVAGLTAVCFKSFYREIHKHQSIN